MTWFIPGSMRAVQALGHGTGIFKGGTN
ncbi:uncharacterized protein METZ01_LOCUS187131 [marine metagenome]|uniref:Uncharacterized protein n=1 Tax=marine metagenome TaxID=408172 RepID=A0A382D9F6_9ZZZZ